MEKMVKRDLLSSAYKGKKVFLTGHTGFKGSWLTLMLKSLGSDVKGYSLEPFNKNDLYHKIDGDSLCDSTIADIRNREQLIDLLRDGKIDIAVMGLVPKEIDTKIFVIANHPHVFVAGANHSLSKLRKIDPQLLNDFDLITRESGSGTRAHMELFFQDNDIQPNIIMEMSSNESIKQAVIADLGISFVSQHTIASEIKDGILKILDVKNTPILRKWHVVTLNPRSLTRSVELLKDFILSQSQTILSKLES